MIYFLLVITRIVMRLDYFFERAYSNWFIDIIFTNDVHNKPFIIEVASEWEYRY